MLDKIVHAIFWKGIGLLIILLVWPVWLYITLMGWLERKQRGS